VRRAAVGAFVVAAFGCAAMPMSASALNPLKPVCRVAGLMSGVIGKACTAVQNGGRVIAAGEKLVSGHIDGAAQALSSSSAAVGVTRAVGMAAIAASALGGAKAALDETASLLSTGTEPRLRSAWFSASYWRMAAIACVLTLPFLCAAAVQAMIRSDLALLLRAALGYLPLAMLAVAIAAPLTMLLLAAADELSRAVSGAAGGASGHFLRRAGAVIGALTAASASPFLAFLVGALTVAGALVLWLELLMREVAVYVVVLMLPLAFAAMVWPARRVWATRAVELLLALVLSKFAMVAVLSLGGAAMGGGLRHVQVATSLTGLVVLLLSAFTPWALLRLMPLAEVAAGAVGTLHGESRVGGQQVRLAWGAAGAVDDWAATTAAQMDRDARATPATADSPSAAPPDAPSAAATHAPSAAATHAPRAAAPNAPSAAATDMPNAATATARPPAGHEGRASGELAVGESAGDQDASGAGERLPGFGPMFQHEDYGWWPLQLGAENGVLPEWPPGWYDAGNSDPGWDATPDDADLRDASRTDGTPPAEGAAQPRGRTTKGDPL
jgi:hypothetical protein